MQSLCGGRDSRLGPLRFATAIDQRTCSLASLHAYDVPSAPGMPKPYRMHAKHWQGRSVDANDVEQRAKNGV